MNRARLVLLPLVILLTGLSITWSVWDHERKAVRRELLSEFNFALGDAVSRIEQRMLRREPRDFKALYVPEFADQVMVKYYRGGKWSEPIAVTDAKQDIVRVAVAAEGNGDVWVIL